MSLVEVYELIQESINSYVYKSTTDDYQRYSATGLKSIRRIIKNLEEADLFKEVVLVKKILQLLSFLTRLLMEVILC